MQEKTWPGEDRDGARWSRWKPLEGRNSRPAMESSTTEEAKAAKMSGYRELPSGLAREERGGRMVGWGCQQRIEEKIG